MKILLLGGNGYIGSKLYDFLKIKNYQVDNVDLCWFGKVFDDTLVKDYDSLTKEFINSYTHIILLASHSSVSMCTENLSTCFNNNVTKFINLLEKTNNDQIIIYGSTAAVYGNNSETLVDEDFPIGDAINYYDYTKICNEQIIKLFPNKQIVTLRFGTVGGFSKNFRKENLINSISLSAINDNKIIISNPDKYRSVLSINDLCRSIEKVLIDGLKEKRIFNLSSISLKIIEFGQIIKKITNCKLLVNDLYKTDYSFNCSNKLFEETYNFKFLDTTEIIYNDILENNKKIMYSNYRR